MRRSEGGEEAGFGGKVRVVVRACYSCRYMWEKGAF